MNIKKLFYRTELPPLKNIKNETQLLLRLPYGIEKQNTYLVISNWKKNVSNKTEELSN